MRPVPGDHNEVGLATIAKSPAYRAAGRAGRPGVPTPSPSARTTAQASGIATSAG
jgi:hypothetical protein